MTKFTFSYHLSTILLKSELNENRLILHLALYRIELSKAHQKSMYSFLFKLIALHENEK